MLSQSLVIHTTTITGIYCMVMNVITKSYYSYHHYHRYLMHGNECCHKILLFIPPLRAASTSEQMGGVSTFLTKWGGVRAFLTNFIVLLVTLTNYINILKNKEFLKSIWIIVCWSLFYHFWVIYSQNVTLNTKILSVFSFKVI